MWSQIGLLLLVCLASASKNPGWKENSEYTYHVRGRTLASLHEISNQYSGILLKADLVIQPRQDGKLNVKMPNAQYAQVHSKLPDGWNTHIPDSELSYKPMDMSNLPFQIDMKNGVIRDLIVDKTVPNWEANIIKSIMSQFQLDTNGKNSLGGRPVGSSESEDNKVFKTMEETVTGNTETSYDIHPIPEYKLQGGQWKPSYYSPMKGEYVIEVVKHKNYSNSQELPSYHYGFAGIGNWKPATNQMGNFSIRDSMSRAILRGNINHYTVHNTYTVNEIMMSPTLGDKQKGSVVSTVNVTLEKIGSMGEPINDPQNPVHLGGLVYTYDKPFSKSEGPRVRKGHSDSDESSSQEGGRRHPRSLMMDNKMLRRSANEEFGYQSDDSSDSEESGESEEFYKQDQPQLDDVPQSPLLPYTTGYKGKSIKHEQNVDIKKSVKQIAKEIGKHLQDPEECLRENALNKFTIMTSLIRIMDKADLQQVSSDLYNQASSQGSAEREAWESFRDAVAESGTGPAFLTIQFWIQTDKIKESEAAHVVATMTKAVRAPTVEYVQSYFDFIKKQEVQSQKHLNETALMAFTNFVRKVYVDPKKSKNQYPVKSFGSFRTSEGKKLVEDGIIPYLSGQLNDAISRADTEKIHAYIRALGNVGHPKILAAFQPYLEGEKKASQFQRVLMVVSMDKLCETNPKYARDVLYKIYQNSGESQEVRTVAVHQLMRTGPPTSMLQRMADYTNVDSHEHVNAAVKSSIESAAELDGDEFHHLRSSAEAAKPLLTKKEYGLHHGSNYLRTYVHDELRFKHTMQSIGNDGGYYPKGLRYSVRANAGGLRKQMGTIQAIVSSVQELVHVGKLQTASYQEEREHQKRQSPEQEKEQFSSQYIAKMLNMEGDEREQLEGYMYMELHDYFYKMMSFDNRSIERLPEDIRKHEEEFRNGKDYKYTKLSNDGEMAIAFPTEMGLPFMYTYDTPALYKVEGHLQGAASPQISRDGKLHKPDTVKIDSKVEATVSWKIQSRLSFFTPFDHQQYISGFDKNLQVHVPLYGQVEVDIKNKKFKAEIHPEQWHKGAQLFHYSSWPYTSNTDINNLEPISKQHNTHHIKQTNMRSYERVFGKKETGMAWQVKINHERESLTLSKLYNLVQKHGVVGGMLSLRDEASIQHAEMSIRYHQEGSSLHKCVVGMSYPQKYKSQFNSGDIDSAYWTKLSQMVRQDGLPRINNADERYGDVSVEFQGDENIKYTAVGVHVKSNVDPRSFLMVYGEKSSDKKGDKPYYIFLYTGSDIPNTNGLDLSYSMMKEPKADIKYNVIFGEKGDTPSGIDGEIKLRRSEGRKEYLQNLPKYRQCQREMHEGNYQLPACANMTMSSNLLDEVSMNIKHKNMKPDLVEKIKTMYSAFKVNYYPTLQSKKDGGSGKEGEINLHAHFDPDLKFVNVSVQLKDEETNVSNIQVGEMGQTVLVVHPVFHVRSRIMKEILGGLQTYRPICVVDKTAISTFNYRTYPASLDQNWAVVFQYVPKEGRHQSEPISLQDQLKQQTEHYVVLARQSPESGEGKDIMITLSSPETDHKVLKITMKPQQGSQDKKVKVQVNGEEVNVSDKKSHDIKNGYVQIYGLPNGEVKVEVRDNFYAIYDGRRIRLAVNGGKFRDTVRGLCGAFSSDITEDFLTPGNCIVSDPKHLIESYSIQSGGSGHTKAHQCVPKEGPMYVKVIPREEGLSRGSHSGDCTKHQTRYVEKGGEICFTTREIPVCGGHCKQHGLDVKTVSVHCMKKSNAAQLWKSQIDRGHSPDFSHKKETKIVEIKVPRSCSP